MKEPRTYPEKGILAIPSCLAAAASLVLRLAAMWRRPVHRCLGVDAGLGQFGHPDQSKKSPHFPSPLWLIAALHVSLCALLPIPAAASQFKVLLPDKFDGSKNYRVLYLLPVEARTRNRFGDALEVIREIDAHNRYELIVVEPGFDVDPWYGNHATDPLRRYEDQVVLGLVPDIDRRYPTIMEAKGRLLLGFDKSGWGAFTLILRHPDVFGYAASWDAPLMMTSQHFGIWKTDQTFGTAANMAGYLPSVLLREQANEFKANTRLVLAGKNLFGTSSDRRYPYRGRSHTEAAHALMVQLGIRHRYDPNLKANHTWNARWVKPVLEMLCGLAESGAVHGRLNTSNP